MTPTAIQDLQTALPVPEGGIASKPLLDLKDSTKVVLFALDAGQEITAHVAPFPAEIIALGGRIDILVGATWYALETHQAIELPMSIPHGIRAQEPAHFLLLMRRGAPQAALEAQAREEAEGHGHSHGHGHCHDHEYGCDKAHLGPTGQVTNPTLLKWQEEHEEAKRRMDLMEAANRRADWGAVKEQALWLYQELKAHNEAEEAHLFPLMDPFFNGHGPTACMREEHRQLWDLTLKVLGDITDGAARNPQATDRMTSSLITSLRSHIDKENNVLYPMAEKILDADTLARLAVVFSHA